MHRFGQYNRRSIQLISIKNFIQGNIRSFSDSNWKDFDPKTGRRWFNQFQKNLEFNGECKITKNMFANRIRIINEKGVDELQSYW